MQNKSKYKSLAEWKQKCPLAYSVAIKKGLLRNICKKFGWKINNPIGFWNIKKNVLKDAKIFKTKAEWKKNNSSPYASAVKNGWLNECCKHMTTSIKTKHYCKKDAKRFTTRTQWLKESKTIYHYAHDKGWLIECCSHMISIKKPNGYWTKEKCIEEARNFNSTKEWSSISSSSYSVAKTKGWLDDCRAHMKERKRATSGIWTKEKCIKDAKNYTGRFEWQLKNKTAYLSALKNGWLNKCCSHMIKYAKRKI